jgi:hypothetical protein
VTLRSDIEIKADRFPMVITAFGDASERNFHDNPPGLRGAKRGTWL